eukprot:Selendium_serpulae@DN3902_c0_g1_i1.p1
MKYLSSTSFVTLEPTTTMLIFLRNHWREFKCERYLDDLISLHNNTIHKLLRLASCLLSSLHKYEGMFRLQEQKKTQQQNVQVLIIIILWVPIRTSLMTSNITTPNHKHFDNSLFISDTRTNSSANMAIQQPESRFLTNSESHEDL